MSGFKELMRGAVYATPQTWALYVTLRRFLEALQTPVLREVAEEMDERAEQKTSGVGVTEVERGMEQLFLRLGPPPTPTRQTAAYVSWRAGCEARTSITLRR